MIPIILSKEKQAYEYFMKEVKSLFEEEQHYWPRPDDGCYYTTEFNKNKADQLFIDLKHFWTIQNIK